MKVKKCLPKIATSLLSVLDFVLVTVAFACAAEAAKNNPQQSSHLFALVFVSWMCWYFCVLLLHLGHVSSKHYGFCVPYGILCVLRLGYNVLLMVLLAVLALFVPRASLPNSLSDVMATLTGPFFDNALASMEIRLTAESARPVIGWMLVGLLCYSLLLAGQLTLLLHCVMPSRKKTTGSVATTTAATASKKTTGGAAPKIALLDV